MGDAKGGLPPGDVRECDLASRRSRVVETPVAKDAPSRRIRSPDRMLAIEEPSVRLEQVRGVSNVGRQSAVLSSHAVDLKRELDRNGEPLELPREVRHGGSAEALTVEDEAVAPRLPPELERDVAAPVLERLGGDTPAAGRA